MQEITNWISALLSGNYSQRKHYLHWKGKHCALGVLCSEDKAYPMIPYTPVVHGIPIYHSRFFYWLAKSGYAEEIARRNDQGESFTAIAHYIADIVRPLYKQTL